MLFLRWVQDEAQLGEFARMSISEDSQSSIAHHLVAHRSIERNKDAQYTGYYIREKDMSKASRRKETVGSINDLSKEHKSIDEQEAQNYYTQRTEYEFAKGQFVHVMYLCALSQLLTDVMLL